MQHCVGVAIAKVLRAVFDDAATLLKAGGLVGHPPTRGVRVSTERCRRSRIEAGKGHPRYSDETFGPASVLRKETDGGPYDHSPASTRNHIEVDRTSCELSEGLRDPAHSTACLSSERETFQDNIRDHKPLGASARIIQGEGSMRTREHVHLISSHVSSARQHHIGRQAHNGAGQQDLLLPEVRFAPHPRENCRPRIGPRIREDRETRPRTCTKRNELGNSAPEVWFRTYKDVAKFPGRESATARKGEGEDESSSCNFRCLGVRRPPMRTRQTFPSPLFCYSICKRSECHGLLPLPGLPLNIPDGGSRATTSSSGERSRASEKSPMLELELERERNACSCKVRAHQRG